MLKGAGGDDWLYGGTENDTLDGGHRNDSLFGEAGDDILEAYAGRDIMHGGVSLATQSTQTAIEADGADDADYRTGASSGIIVHLTSQAIDSILAQNVDAAYGTFVTSRAEGTDRDPVISIETLFATDHDDVVRISEFNPLKLAGADGTGGLRVIDLGLQSQGTLDIIDFSGMGAAMTAQLDSGGRKVHATTDPSLSLLVHGAEAIIGSG